MFHVLEGRSLLQVDGKRFHAETGDVVSVPGGAPGADALNAFGQRWHVEFLGPPLQEE